jgi:MFS family permease
VTDTADDAPGTNGAEDDGRRPRSRFAQALAPLALRSYRLLWLGSTTSSLGDAVVQIALVFAVLHIGGNATDIGVIEALQTVARVVFLLAGGVWADRLRRQFVMLGADVLRGGVEAALAVLLLTGHARVWEIALGAVLYGIGASFFGPASTGLTPEIVPAEQLQQANSLLDLPQSFFSVGGPAVGGVLIAVFGPGWLFAFDAATFAVSVISLALLRLPPRSLPKAGSFLADLAEGWHELAIRPWYWINLLAHACWNFAVPALLVLGPVISARSLGGATAWGLISASFGVGAVFAGLFVLRVKPRRPLVVGNLLLTLGALPLLALALSRSVPLICVANALSGFGLVSLNGLWTPTMQVLIPENVRSRVDSYDWIVSLVIMPVGYAIAGPLASSVGFTSTLVAAAIVISVPCGLVVLVPGVRGVHRNASGEIVGPAPTEPALSASAG